MPITSNNTNVFAETVSGGGGGTPASSVVTQTSYGQSSAVGTSTDYARADHSHGTPASILGPSNSRFACATAAVDSFGTAAGASYGGWDLGSGHLLNGTSIIVNNVLYADGNGWSGDWCSASNLLPQCETVVSLSGVLTNCKVVSGFDGGSSGGAVGSAGVTHDQAFFYFDSASNPGMTNFFLVTTDAASNVTSIDTGVTVAVNTKYKLKVQFTTATTVVASINDTVVATSTTTTPDVGILMKAGVVSTSVSLRFNRAFALDGV